jgi:hypothetical protein
MTTKADVLRLMAEGKGPLGRVADDEPVFVLRAQDVMAPGFVELWSAALATAHAAFERPTTSDERLKVMTSKMTAEDMRKWQNRHGAKLPD